MTWDEIIEQVARQLHEGKLNGIISPVMVQRIAADLMAGAFKGYGKDFDTPSLAAQDFDQLKSIEENVYVFSGFKNYQQLKETTLLLKDADGNIRSFADFFADVKVLDKTYNRFYAQAEYNHALNTSNAISRWQQMQQEKSALRFLTWRTVTDEHNCPVCGTLNNVHLPVDHPFWVTHFYPAHFNCRCVVEQSDDETLVTKEEDIAKHTPIYPEAWKMFKNNAGITGVVFPEKHPYYQANEDAKKKVNAAVANILQENESADLLRDSSYKKDYDRAINRSERADFEYLTNSEYASVYHYTNNGYYDLNVSLRTNKADTHKLLFEKTLNRALSKLDIWGESEIYRGTQLTQNQLSRYRKAMKSGGLTTEKSFFSCSYEPSTAEDFGAKKSGKMRVLFFIEHKDGRIVEGISTHPEYEVLIKSKSKFRVIDFYSEKDDDGIIYKITMKQEE